MVEPWPPLTSDHRVSRASTPGGCGHSDLVDCYLIVDVLEVVPGEILAVVDPTVHTNIVLLRHLLLHLRTLKSQ